ncbi:LacI family DNA-binding transcriptional regulator [Microbacterium sp. APC 3898]|uniref:LacI family DNA-binding transcriptional regulator n=1 Tax=Planococcus notacanthi TaxID=3035188 RepID=A0ABT7ZH34_9BACL|nr:MULTISPECIES: LacI family DNA-binding transcriptional regulator [Terrabacteria group]MDN3426468.1 LacI family DNA-binding transcriptional regulator [Planococcus sp. APC 4016]MDN3501094.1 LacI family DNA-binding transcriptional regulator [Microbacterium sp. APC 3898]
MVSSKDVAKYAGVSQTTVSRVVNTPHLVKKPTLQKVMAAIDALNYIPDANARSLVQKRTHTIALISGPLSNPFFVETTTAIVNVANANGFRINVHFSNDQNLAELYNVIFENKVDGIILSSILLDDPAFEKLEKSGIPFITFNRKHKSDKYFVEMDNVQAGYLSAEHLLSLGHENLCWIGGPLEMSTFKGRYDGFLKAAEKLEAQVKPERIFITDTSAEDLYQTFLTLESMAEKPTAIISATDAIALHMMDFYISAGYRVPEDISIIGIDNVATSRHASIQLTTVGISSTVGLGQLAIEKLIHMIQQKNSSCIRITENVRLFERNTTLERK